MDTAPGLRRYGKSGNNIILGTVFALLAEVNMWLLIGIAIVFLLVLSIWKRLNTYVLIAKKLTYIYEILLNDYKKRFPDEDTLLMTCGIIDTLSYAFSVEDMKRAVLSAKTGEYSLDLAHHKLAFDTREILSGRDQLLNFVLQLEAMMFLEDMSHGPRDILSALASLKANIKRAIESAKQSYSRGNRPAALHHVVSNFMTSDSFGEVRNELNLIPFGRADDKRAKVQRAISSPGQYETR